MNITSPILTGAANATELPGDTVTSVLRAFGAGSPEPVLALPGHQLAYVEEVGQSHLRARLRSGDGSTLNVIAFRAVGQKLGAALLNNRGRAVHAAGSLAVDRWTGEERVQLRLIDIAPAGG